MSVLRKLLEDAINNLERYILGVKSMTSKVKVVWIQSAHTSRLFDEMSGAVMADITHVNLGMFGPRPACVVSVDGGDGKDNDDMTWGDMISQNYGHEYSMRDVVKSGWVARVLAESFIEQREVYKQQ